MSPPRRDGDASIRRFLLEATPEEGSPRLLPEDEEHALRVLRLAAGDRIVGLDGRGRAWPLEVVSARARGLALRPLAEPEDEPPPGSPGARLPWVELYVPLPRAGRAEEMVDRLTQLGLSRLVPLLTRRTAPHAREISPARLERLRRTAREAIKQCGRLWLPVIESPEPIARLHGGEGLRIVAEPSAAHSLREILEASPEPRVWSRSSPLVLIAGPEGGLDEEERQRLAESGVREARLAPYTLRTETAAEAAVAMAVCAAGACGSPGISDR